MYLPTGLIATASALPRCCTRHGRPAVTTRRVTFYSRPEPWSYLLLLLGVGVLVLLVISLTRKRYYAPAWPFCDLCQAQRRRSLRLGWGIGLSGAVVASGLGFAMAATNEGLSVLLLVIGFAVAPLIGGILGSRGTWGSLAGGSGRRDGNSVEFARPAAEFSAALNRPAQYTGTIPGTQYLPPQPAAQPSFPAPAPPQLATDPRFPAPAQFPPDPRFPAPPQ